MSKNEMVERTRQALEAFEKLPAEEQFRQLIVWGVIDAKGDVLFRRDEAARKREQPTRSTVASAAEHIPQAL